MLLQGEKRSPEWQVPGVSAELQVGPALGDSPRCQAAGVGV